MLKVAVVGAGNICDSHINGYLSFPDRCRIVGIADIYPEKAAEKKAKHSLDCVTVDDYRALLSEREIDLVSVCTPPYTHGDIAVDFLNAGANVLVEKPMAASLVECDRMIEAAKRSGRVLSVVSQNRFLDPMIRLKKVLESGLAGRIVHAQVDSHWWRGHSYYDLWWRGTWEKEGGGCTLNHAVHHIDIFQWMMGFPESLQAVMTNTSHDNAEVEDLSVAILRYADGALAQITSSVVHHGQEQQLIFQGTNARVSVPWRVYGSTSRSNGFPDENVELEKKIDTFWSAVPELRHTGHAGQIDDVMRAIESGSENVLVTAEQGRKTLELITGIYQSASTGREVHFPLNSESAFYSREGIMANARHFYEKKTSVEGFEDNQISLGGEYSSKK